MLRYILNDFEANANGNHFDYYITQGEKYFYEFLKPLADTTNLVDADFIDWGNADNYVKQLSRENVRRQLTLLLPYYWKPKIN
jgi:hypothetical protein